MEKNKEWLKKEVEDYLAIEGVYDARTALKAVLEYIDQLYEPNEIELSEPSAWKMIAKLYHPNEVYWGNVRDSYLESLDEPEKVVVPQFVADFITEIKPNFNIRTVFTLKNNKHEQGQEWALDNPDVFARAWLDGYSIEKEKLYRVKVDQGPNYLYVESLHLYKDVVEPLDFNHKFSVKDHALKFTSRNQAKGVAELVGGEVEEVTK